MSAESRSGDDRATLAAVAADPLATCAQTVADPAIRPPAVPIDPEACGEYELVDEIARGGMGIVYRARHRTLHREVALKRIVSGDLSTPQQVQRFLLEAESAANLDHPNIVPIYEVGERSGRPFFTMKLIEGGSLGQRVVALQGQPRRSAELMAKVARAVQFAHARGILHRDLKPANILVDASGEPYVTDFGLAKRLDGGGGMTESGSVVGTPAYMSPEQAAGRTRELSTACDVYSLGAVLYELLTGRPPFVGASSTDVLLQVLEREPARPRSLNPAVDRELEAVCLRCLEKDPAARYGSAGEVADDLETYLRGEPVVAAAASGSRRLARRLMRATQHTEVMERWGRVWIAHAVEVLLLGLAANVLIWNGIRTGWPLLALWVFAIAVLAVTVWLGRVRGGPPLDDLELKVAQVWGLFAVTRVFTGLMGLYVGLPALALFPIAVMECGMAFGCTAIILGGSFYVTALACIALGALLALAPQVGPALFGPLMAGGLLLPGLRYSRRSGRDRA